MSKVGGKRHLEVWMNKNGHLDWSKNTSLDIFAKKILGQPVFADLGNQDKERNITEMPSTKEDWKNHINGIVIFFNDKGIKLPALEEIKSLIKEQGFGTSKNHQKIANREGSVDAVMGSLWSSVEECTRRGDLIKSSISFLFSLTRKLKSAFPLSTEQNFFLQTILAFLRIIFRENNDVTKLADMIIDDEAFKHEMKRVVYKLSKSQIYLSDMNATPPDIDKNAIKALVENVDINTGVVFLGNLRDRIKSLISCDMSKPEAERCIAYMNLYVRISLLRKSALLQILTALRSIDYSPQSVAAITKGMKKDNALAKDLLSFLETPTIEKSVTLFAFFDFSEQEHITRFASKLNIKLQDLRSDLDNKELYIQPSSGKEYVISRPNLTWIWGLYKEKRQTSSTNAIFRFEFLSGSRNRCYVRSSDRKYYVWMKEDRFCKCCIDKPDEDGEWIVIRVADKETSYLLSPKKWPNRFIYLEKWMSEYVRGLDDKRIYGSVKQCLFKLEKTATKSPILQRSESDESNESDESDESNESDESDKPEECKESDDGSKGLLEARLIEKIKSRQTELISMRRTELISSKSKCDSYQPFIERAREKEITIDTHILTQKLDLNQSHPRNDWQHIGYNPQMAGPMQMGNVSHVPYPPSSFQSNSYLT